MDVAQAGQGTAEPRPGGKGDVGRGVQVYLCICVFVYLCICVFV